MNVFNRASLAISAFCLGIALPIAAFAAGPATVDLSSASNFVVLSKTGITNTGSHTSLITGNVGSSPITAAAMNNVFCSEIIGTIFGVDAAYVGSGDQTCFAGNPPLSNKTLVDNAILDMATAYVDAAGRALPDGTELYAGNLGGQTFTPGLYKWSTDVTIPTSVTLSGGASDVWIFQIAGNLNIASGGSVPAGIKVLLSGGAQASNVFWQVGGLTGATLGTYSTFNGNILSAKQVILQTGAVLNGRALAQTQVVLDANTISVTAVPIPATLHIIKLVVNASVGTSTASDFSVHVKNAGVDVVGSPMPGAAAPGTSYSLSGGTYVVSENANALYVQSFSGDCDVNGSITLSAGDDKICTIINTDIPPPPPVPPAPPAPPAPSSPSSSSQNTTSGQNRSRIVPLIGVLKVPSPLALSRPGPVTYIYTVWNVGGVANLTGITLTDDKCSPINFLSGDLNSNTKIDPGETWKYACTAALSQTTTNTTVATGHSDDDFNQTAIATAIATVIVGAPIPGLPNTGFLPTKFVPPLINVIIVPSQLTPLPFGGGEISYAYTVTNPGVVPMHDVAVTDNRCAPTMLTSGDTNSNRLLDPGERWIYICQSDVPVSTRSIAMAVGKANGLTNIGYAFADVLVTAPGLPNTGLSGSKVAMVLGILLAGCVAFYLMRKRATA